MSWYLEGKLLARTNPLGHTEHFIRDPEGNLLSHTDVNGGTTTYTYGAFDLPVTRTEPDGACHEYSHDTELRLVRVTNPLRLTWDYTYDPAGSLVAQTDFDDRTVRYVRDAAGRTETRINARGEGVFYTYDTRNLVVSKRTSDEETTRYHRDAVGRVVSATNGHSSLTRTYDARGSLLTETVNGHTTTYGYDNLGRLSQRVTPAGVTSTWAYDADSRPTVLTVGGTRLTFKYDEVGRETQRKVSDILTLNQMWDPAGRLISRAARGAGDHFVSEATYTYRPDGFPTTLTDLTGETRFTLDPVGRITAAAGPRRRERYTYDPVGNITESHCETPATATQAPSVGEEEGAAHSLSGLRLVRNGAFRYEHDEAGRTILRQKKNLSRKSDTWRYTWNADDQLTRVVTPDGTVWRYQYDPFGRRLSKERLKSDQDTVVETIKFTWSDATVIEQSTHFADDSERASLTWEHREQHPVAQVEYRQPAESQSDDAISRRFFAIVTDLIGSPIQLVTGDGEIAWQEACTVWGAQDGSPPEDNSADTPLRFPGQYRDQETGWNYNVHRHYDPTAGRYATPDPLGLAPAANPYGYPHNPLTGSDPEGLAGHPGGTAGFRKQTDHPLSQRMHADEYGNVSITGRGQLYVNLSGDISHTSRFRRGDGDILEFRVRDDFLEKVQNTAVPQKNPGMFTEAEWKEMKRICPEISDPTKGSDLYGIPGSMLREFESAILPGSGRELDSFGRRT